MPPNVAATFCVNQFESVDHGCRFSVRARCIRKPLGCKSVGVGGY